MRKDVSMHKKIITIQFIAIVIIMAIFASYLYTTNYKTELNALKIETEQLAVKLSSYLAPLVWNFDKNTSQSIIAQDIQNKNIISILVYQGGDFWIGKLKTENDKIIDITNPADYENIFNKSFIKRDAKISYDGKDAGRITLYITDKYMNTMLFDLLIQIIIQTIVLVIALSIILYVVLNLFLARQLKKITETAERIANGEVELQATATGQKEIIMLANAFNAMTTELRKKAEMFQVINNTLTQIISEAKDIVVNLNSSSKEIQSAAQTQSNSSLQYASGITELSTTLHELTINAKQITTNVGELTNSSEAMTNLLRGNNVQLLATVSELDDVGRISLQNTTMIGELGKRSVIVNEMAELIKEIANKTNILSINASIEASRSREAASGFSVIAAEIRTLSKETIESAKKAESAAKDIQMLLDTIIEASESESTKIIESCKIARTLFTSNENIMTKITNNFNFTQKIAISLKQQETSSSQTSETIKELADIAKQSAEIARQTLLAVKSIVNLSSALEKVIRT